MLMYFYNSEQKHIALLASFVVEPFPVTLGEILRLDTGNSAFSHLWILAYMCLRKASILGKKYLNC